MNCFDFLKRSEKGGPKAVYLVAGEELFLRDRALEHIRRLVLGKDPDESAVTVFDGATVAPVDVVDELATLPMFAARRLVMVDPAEPFVAVEGARNQIEAYLERPAKTSTLVLVAAKWNKSYRLTKIIDKGGAVVDCKAPRAAEAPQWAALHTRNVHGKTLTPAAARLLVEVVGEEMSRLAGEMDKLASYVGDRAEVTDEDVDAVVVSARQRTSWQLMDAICDGRTADAIGVLGQLALAGEEPVAILAAIGWQLRRMVRAAHLVAAGRPGNDVCREVGVPPFASRDFLRRVNRLGPDRLRAWHGRLLEADLQLKGDSQLRPRTVLERWIVEAAS